MSSTLCIISISFLFMIFQSLGSEIFYVNDLNICFFRSNFFSIVLNAANTSSNSSSSSGSMLNYLSKPNLIPCNSLKLSAVSSACLRACSNRSVLPQPKSYVTIAFSVHFLFISLLIRSRSCSKSLSCVFLNFGVGVPPLD